MALGVALMGAERWGWGVAMVFNPVNLESGRENSLLEMTWHM